MCSRFTQLKSWSDLIRIYRITAAAPAPNALARYNIAPTQQVAVIRQAGGGGRELLSMRWGLVPSWAKDETIGNRMINARAETVLDKPAFRNAMRQRRCLIPADGFYEWQKRDKGGRQPYRITRLDEEPFAFAGLWEQWDKTRDRPPLLSCTILTTNANALVAPIHDRVPVMLTADDFAMWLETGIWSAEQAATMCRPFPAAATAATPVSPLVNRAGNDEPVCIAPILG
jgi:putative SOS response-associated peptidase YedK